MDHTPNLMRPGESNLLVALLNEDGKAVTLFLSSGGEYPCHVTTIRGGLVYTRTDLSTGVFLLSSILGYTTDNGR